MSSSASASGVAAPGGPTQGDGLRVESAHVTFPGAAAPALADVDLHLPTGRVLAVLGPSGCGKSTLLRVIAGLQPSAGRVLFDGQDVTRLPTHKRDFALMFQDGQLFGHMDVAGNVGYALKRRGASRQAIEARVKELLDLVGLEGLGERRPATLSGGQQQRVALARALAAKPRLLLLDEPLSALDRTLRERLAGDLRRVLVAEGTTALLVTHDHDEALSVADDMALMRAGCVVQSGTALGVWRHPVDVDAAAFLGYSTVLTPDEAAAFGLERRTWALRRSGLRVVEPGQGRVAGGVVAMAAAGEAVHIDVEVPDFDGRIVQAVADSSDEALALEAGATVALDVRPSSAVCFG